MSSKISKDISRLVMTSADPNLFGTYGIHREVLYVLALKDALFKASAEFEIARALRLVKKTNRAKNVLENIRVSLRKHSLRLQRKSDLNPNAPVWIPQGLRRPRMMRYHVLNTPGETHGVVCA